MRPQDGGLFHGGSMGVRKKDTGGVGEASGRAVCVLRLLAAMMTLGDT
jgi:hypothetical protein